MTPTIKNTIQDCNINFLIGSGCSYPFLQTLGPIETLLSDLEESKAEPEKKDLIRASIYKRYFDGALSKNAEILAGAEGAKDVLEKYNRWIAVLNAILLRRKSTILSKQINLFTTNVDIFMEKSLESLGVEFNDGFNGRFSPVFGLSNFKKSQFKKSLHYENTSEVPVFNLMKLHGSLSWQLRAPGSIEFSAKLDQLASVAKLNIPAAYALDIPQKATIAGLLAAAAGKTTDPSVAKFMEEYDKLLIVNPTKEKFKHTLLNQTYYELLRIFSNEMEKENTVLFVMGFSFADEHIREITLRAANSNPTLIIYVIAYSTEAKTSIEKLFGLNSAKNRNIKFISPGLKKTESGELEDDFFYDLAAITERIFSPILNDSDFTPVPTETSDTSQQP